MPPSREPDGNPDAERDDWLDQWTALAWQLRTVVESGTDPGPGVFPVVADSSLRTREVLDPVDVEGVLADVCALDLSAWRYGSEDGDTRHIGPTAATFRDAVGFGADGECIAAVDADGVALAAIQGLAERVDDQREVIEVQREAIETQRAHVRAQRERLDACEAHLDALESSRPDGSDAP